MKISKRIRWLVLAGIFLAGFAFYGLRLREPVYEGKQLRAWLEDLSWEDKPSSMRAKTAVQRIGSNAVPVLLDELRLKDSRFFGANWVNRYTPFQIMPADARRGRALLGFRALGAEGRSAIPELIDLLREERSDVTRALVWIGPEAIPPLIRALTNQNDAVRNFAAYTLGSFATNVQAAAPSLIKCLDDQHPSVRFNATRSLALIGANPEIVVPALVRKLKDPDHTVRCSAAYGLRSFGEQAKAVVPALLQALRDTDSEVRACVADALKHLDPETAVNAGIEKVRESGDSASRFQ